jgi:hypothetical protein
LIALTPVPRQKRESEYIRLCVRRLRPAYLAGISRSITVRPKVLLDGLYGSPTTLSLALNSTARPTRAPTSNPIMAKRKATDLLKDLDDVPPPPVKASKHEVHSAAWSLPAGYERGRRLPTDRDRPTISSLADFYRRNHAITHFDGETGSSGRTITNGEAVEEGGEEEEEDDNGGQAGDDKEDEDLDAKEVTVLALLALPNARTEPAKISRQQEEKLVDLHVQPFRDPNAVGYATATGARKYGEHTGVLLHTSYTPDVKNLITNTGASKDAWTAGVDPATHYAGDVMLFPAVEGVHKGFHLDSLIIARCDEPTRYVDAETQTDVDLLSSSPARLHNFSSAMLPPYLPFQRAAPVPDELQAPGRGAARFAFATLKTSAEPTFERAAPRKEEGDTMYAAPLADDPPLPLPSPPEPSSTNGHPSSAEFPTLQAMIQAQVVPSNLNELDLLVDSLAKSLNISPNPSYLDMHGCNSFDLQKEMLLYTRPLKRRDGQPIDYSGMLLGLLNSGEKSGSTYSKDGRAG